MKRHLLLIIVGLVATTAPLFQGCTTHKNANAPVLKPLPLVPYVDNTKLEIPSKGLFVQPKPPPQAVSRSRTASNAEEGTMYPVWFGTNRKPEVISQRLTYTSKRDNGTHYGRVDVWVPEAHRRGETGNPFWRRFLRGEFRDDNLAIRELKILQRDAFYDEVRQIIQTAVADGNESQALVFIHGFNVSFEEAAIRAAQIGFDLKVPGPMALFSWPSLGSMTPQAYKDDGTMITNSRTALVDFLVEFAQKSEAKNVNIIAHSMGNRGLLQALQHIAADAELRGSVKFNQIILAAPDITREVFEQAAQVYPQFSKRTTVYTSSRDLALRVAPVVGMGGPRAGYFKPYTVADGVDTIVVPNFNVDLLGHSDFAQADALLYDIEALCATNKDPHRRPRIDPFKADGKEFWKLRR